MQLIVLSSVWVSTSPNSELITEVKVNVLGDGFTNKPLRRIVWLLPLVTLLLSGNEVAIIKIPLPEFSIVKEP